MTKTLTSRYDVAEHLRTPEEMAAYLEACFEEAGDDAAFIAKALGDIARAKGMTKVAQDAGLSRESLYKALSGQRSPDFQTILKVMTALGLKLRNGVRIQGRRIATLHNAVCIITRHIGRQQRQLVINGQLNDGRVKFPLPFFSPGFGGDTACCFAFILRCSQQALMFAVKLLHGNGRPPTSLHFFGNDVVAGLVRIGIVVNLAHQPDSG